VDQEDPLLAYRAQHKERLAWMPYLYDSLKPQHKTWAVEWQREVQARFAFLETVTFGADCFVAPSAHLFAEPGRAITAADGCRIGAEVFLHGPITLANNVSINPRCTLDGRAAGITVGEGTRIATGCYLFAFNHELDPSRPIRDQPVHSQGITVGADVWLGANAGVTDGVTIGDHAVVGMGSVVTRDAAPWAVVGGVPACVLGDRRDKKYRRV